MVVQILATNHLGGYDITYNALDFMGKPTRTYKTHGINGASDNITELYTYDYDKAQRPTTTKYSLNGGSLITMAVNTYDELGRLSTKNLGGVDVTTYGYNIRNWTTNITSDGFVENLYYNANPLNSNVTYNGNISYSTWTYNGVNKGYAYTYDNLNRLTLASFKQGSSSQVDGSFDEQFTFDKQGNISTLQRKKDNALIDNLVITPNGNQIASVIDYAGSQNQYSIKEYNNKAGSNEFEYDANGNMKKDLDRNIVAIQYNVLNLPDVVQFKNGNQIKNYYNASGQKLGTEYFTQLTNITPLADGQIISQSYNPGTVDQTGNAYIGTMEYNTLNGNSTLTAISRIYNNEGYVENLGNPQYYYYRKDHLGDNREVWLANTGETVQRTQYYPSGLPWASNSGDNPSKQQRKYNGKEFVEMHGYDTYDYGARGYYAAIGGWPTVDPHAEKYYSISPYAYCEGNPVNAIDPNGKDKKPATDKTTAIDNTSTKVPKEVRSIPIKPVTTLQAAAKIAKTLPKGEIKDANQEKFKEMHNEAMNDPIKKQCLTDPVLQTSASIVLGGGGVAAAKAVAPAVTPLVFKSAQIALENPNTTQSLLGVGIGVFVSTLTGQMQDVPQFTTGLPIVDNASQRTQIFLTARDFFNSITPQTNVPPVNNADDEKK